MNIEDIKIGETYNVRMKVTHKEKDQVCVKNPMISVYGCDYMMISHKYIHAIHEQPKHDPRRLLKKGDIVELVERWGRKLPIKSGQYDVESNEIDNRVMIRHRETGFSYAAIDAVYLQLGTPVEELEPYHILHNVANGYVIYKNELKTDNIVAIFNSTHPRSKEAAEAERDRLNDGWRKEQNTNE